MKSFIEEGLGVDQIVVDKFHALSRIRSGWVLGRTTSPDLAIARLDRDIKFIPGIVAPVCKIAALNIDCFKLWENPL